MGGRSDRASAAHISGYGRLGRDIADDVAFFREEIAIRRRAHAPLDALKPPNLLTDVHKLMVGMSIRQLAAAEGLLSFVLVAKSFEEMQGTPELAECEAANGSGSQICADVQVKLDELADRDDVFEDTQWIPLEVSLAVRGALGCGDIQKT